jgi:hypothetical protein
MAFSIPAPAGEAVFHDASVLDALDALRAAELAEQGLDTRFD